MTWNVKKSIEEIMIVMAICSTSSDIPVLIMSYYHVMFPTLDMKKVSFVTHYCLGNIDDV